MRLEKAINPLLDDDDQVCNGFVLQPYLIILWPVGSIRTCEVSFEWQVFFMTFKSKYIKIENPVNKIGNIVCCAFHKYYQY